MNISDVLSDAAGRCPDHVALIDLDAPGGRREFTFEELWLRVRRTARGLRALGLAPGDRVVTAPTRTNVNDYRAILIA